MWACSFARGHVLSSSATSDRSASSSAGGARESASTLSGSAHGSRGAGQSASTRGASQPACICSGPSCGAMAVMSTTNRTRRRLITAKSTPSTQVAVDAWIDCVSNVSVVGTRIGGTDTGGGAASRSGLMMAAVVSAMVSSMSTCGRTAGQPTTSGT